MRFTNWLSQLWVGRFESKRYALHHRYRGRMTRDGTIVSMKGIHKTYGEVVALEDANLELRRGEVLGLAGDNGAGKSTLIKCLAGAVEPDRGTILMNGEPVDISTPRVAKDLSIETTFQQLALAENLTVTQNVFLGREDVAGVGGFGVLNKTSMRERAEELLAELEIGVDPEAEVSGLSGGEQQLVAISRTLLSDPKIVIMDEPTSALSVEGADRVLNLIRRMRCRGISILLISHNIEYMKKVADRIQVLHHGRDAGVVDAETATRDKLVSLMISGSRSNEEAESPA
ncbi:ATP-binding cassette domain-containing protein [Halegenticoccus soli]|uniref:ATP-binding cassette domain-containing protein n=1 Tax=Halegenticoccus soli TaxID=1985678 RepID=UPI0018EC61B7|nr:ATP-binding cassette domain-containing protein [Halegenticoccus soli]